MKRVLLISDSVNEDLCSLSSKLVGEGSTVLLSSGAVLKEPLIEQDKALLDMATDVIFMKHSRFPQLS